MNIIIEKFRIKDIPVVKVFNNELFDEFKKGTIIFFHGLFSSKDAQLKEFKSLAENGFLVIGIDNVGHGERVYKDIDKRFSSDNPDMENNFIEAVIKTSEEVSLIIDHLLEKQWVYNNKIGIAGISMGGYIVYCSILKDKRIKAAVSILGSPFFEKENSPINYPYKFFPVALLSQNAGKDRSVSSEYSKELHNKLSEYYIKSPEDQKYIEFSDSDHFMLEKDWNICWQNTIDWFNTKL